MNKKADANIFLMIVRFIFVGMILLTIFMFIRLSVSYSFETNKAEADIITARLLYQPDCFLYKDNVLGRVYPNIIDLKEFNEKKLHECFAMHPDSGYYAFRITLLDEKANHIKNITFKPDKFATYEHLHSTSSGIVDYFHKFLFVQYYDGTFKLGTLHLDIYIPKK